MKNWNVKAIINGMHTETTIEAEYGYEVEGILREKHGHVRMIEYTQIIEEKPVATGFVVGEKVLAFGAKNKNAKIVALEPDGVRIQILRSGSNDPQWINSRLVSHL